ncbi:site-specific integrase [Streptomyces brevispora]|uniref:Site-specific integrase n=1 Tax=Streptomyces brevispora TaxID=887462 RepID=A0ABZ1GEZ4_9ACTN|nr:site-specific integrase [Streptomyces brevispora]WSC11502.1 site-specific integrase [Streptomyces brevispora]WSC17609.1 site-specific integrase [Streptomyces brevispora]
MASTAALVAAPDPVRRQRPRHCPEGQYVAAVRGQDSFNRQYLNAKLRYYRDFRTRWPDLEAWFAEPLAERAGRLPGESFHRPSFPTSHRARTYLTYLGLHGYATFDYRWMFAVGQLRVHDQAALLGIDPGTMVLVEEAVALGYNRMSAKQAMHWSVARIVLRNGLTDVADITGDHVAEVLEAIRLFPEDPEFASFYPSAQQFYEGPAKSWITHLHQLEVVLFHRGQVAKQPRKLMPSWKPPLTLPPRMLAVAKKWLAARKLTDAPSTVDKLELAVRTFCRWLEANHPGITTFADVTRDHCLGWIGHIAEAPTEKTGKPLGVMSRIQRISGLSQFFRDTALWQYPDVPGHTLIGAGDAPKFPLKVPRFIPDDELDQLMPAIDAIACPFQRAALLVARWSGARRTEIQRLPMDCLDRYPDGTARLRLSGRKTYKERVVPLHEDAATALQQAIDLRRNAPERPFTDERTGEEIRYLFMSHGKLLSTFYLFETPIQDACKAAGLVRPGGRAGTGRGTVSAHRFRHTVGTQLAERGAKLHTIMKVLGHTSVSMALVYAQISDQEVLRDYKAVLGPGATIAGPAADELRNGSLPDTAVDWLTTNFFKTELELGRCLRLPAEGPCECDLYLTCAKFVTTPEYAPRLRARREVEQTLALDAAQRGWDREVERHRCTSDRIDKLLADLGQPAHHEEKVENTSP